MAMGLLVEVCPADYYLPATHLWNKSISETLTDRSSLEKYGPIRLMNFLYVSPFLPMHFIVNA
jgi:hypothetical protein